MDSLHSTCNHIISMYNLYYFAKFVGRNGLTLYSTGIPKSTEMSRC